MQICLLRIGRIGLVVRVGGGASVRGAGAGIERAWPAWKTAPDARRQHAGCWPDAGQARAEAGIPSRRRACLVADHG